MRLFANRNAVHSKWVSVCKLCASFWSRFNRSVYANSQVHTWDNKMENKNVSKKTTVECRVNGTNERTNEKRIVARIEIKKAKNFHSYSSQTACTVQHIEHMKAHADQPAVRQLCRHDGKTKGKAKQSRRQHHHQPNTSHLYQIN